MGALQQARRGLGIAVNKKRGLDPLWDEQKRNARNMLSRITKETCCCQQASLNFFFKIVKAEKQKDEVLEEMLDITLKKCKLYLVMTVRDLRRTEELIKGFLKLLSPTLIDHTPHTRIRQQQPLRRQNQSQKLDFNQQKHRDSPGYDEAFLVARAPRKHFTLSSSFLLLSLFYLPTIFGLIAARPAYFSREHLHPTPLFSLFFAIFAIFIFILK